VDRYGEQLAQLINDGGDLLGLRAQGAAHREGHANDQLIGRLLTDDADDGREQVVAGRHCRHGHGYARPVISGGHADALLTQVQAYDPHLPGTLAEHLAHSVWDDSQSFGDLRRVLATTLRHIRPSAATAARHGSHLAQ
jgi:hypothetical protein